MDIKNAIQIKNLSKQGSKIKATVAINVDVDCMVENGSNKLQDILISKAVDMLRNDLTSK